jgi:hypothetical protein
MIERMKQQMIKLVCTDVDGTLVPDGTSNLNPRYYDEIKRLTDKGIRFVVASGRPYSSVKHMFAPVLDKIDIIFDNGAGVMMDGEVVYLKNLDRAVSMELIREIEKLPDCHTYVSARRKGYVDKHAQNLYNWLVDGYHIDMQYIEKMPDDLPEDEILCIEMYHPQNAEKIAKQGFYQKWSEGFGLTMNAAGDEWMHINRADACKGDAVKFLKEHLKITREEIMVFGDNMNDIGMLHESGCSYAVANARKEVQNEAAYVTASNREDGVLKVLQTL